MSHLSFVHLTRAAGVAVTCVVIARAARAQQPERWSVVLTIGIDTIATERVTMTPTSVAGDLLTKQGGSRLAWRIGRDATGPRHFALVERGIDDPPNGPARNRVEVAFTGDSAIGVVTNGTAAPVTRRVASSAGAVPYVNPSMAITEMAVRAALFGGKREGTATLFLLNGRSVEMRVTRVGDDSLVASIGPTELRLRTDADGRFLGGAVPAQRLTITRGPWLDDAALKLPKPDYGAPAGAPYTAEEVRVPTGRGYELVGTLTRPSGATGRLAVAVTSTGSGPQDRDEGIQAFGDYRLFRWVADTLGRRGIAVLRLDDRGTGASGGDFSTATSAGFADDVRSALAWLRGRGDVDASKLFVVGHSEGGLVAPMVAATDPQLAGIVLIAGPAQTGRTILNFQLRNGILGDSSQRGAKRDSARARVPAMLDSVLAGSPWMRFFGDHDPIATAKNVRVPVLILQGATDQQVTPEQADALAAALRAGGNRRVTVRLFPETNHLMVADPSGFPGGYAKLPSMAVRPDVLGALADWIAALSGRSAPLP